MFCPPKETAHREAEPRAESSVVSDRTKTPSERASRPQESDKALGFRPIQRDQEPEAAEAAEPEMEWNRDTYAPTSSPCLVEITWAFLFQIWGDGYVAL